MILQTAIPFDPLSTRPLPGIQPCAPSEWFMLDDAYAAQMRHRIQLVNTKGDTVLRLSGSAWESAEELLELTLEALPEGFRRAEDHVICPDGRRVALAAETPLHVLNQILQEDLCLLQKPQGAEEHVLTGAVLCFPASWQLSDKYMRPLTAIHAPVQDYDNRLARRVQRLFDGVQPGRPLWRYNALAYRDAELHQPRSEQTPRPVRDPGAAGFLRSERQTILRLPRTRSVVFAIHTFVVPFPR